MRKVDEHSKLYLSSQTQKFIRYYTFKVDVGRKKDSIKPQSPALAGQKETTCHEEKESRDKPWIFFLVFFCCSNVLISWFRLHRFVSHLRFLFGAHPKMGAAIFAYLHIVLACVPSRLYLVTSNFQTRVIRLLSPGVERRTNLFPVILV